MKIFSFFKNLQDICRHVIMGTSRNPKFAGWCVRFGKHEGEDFVFFEPHPLSGIYSQFCKDYSRYMPHCSLHHTLCFRNMALPHALHCYTLPTERCSVLFIPFLTCSCAGRCTLLWKLPSAIIARLMRGAEISWLSPTAAQRYDLLAALVWLESFIL